MNIEIRQPPCAGWPTPGYKWRVFIDNVETTIGGDSLKECTERVEELLKESEG